MARHEIITKALGQELTDYMPGGKHAELVEALIKRAEDKRLYSRSLGKAADPASDIMLAFIAGRLAGLHESETAKA